MSINGKNLSVTVNGIIVCYDDLGVGQVPILFVHGFPFDKSMWQPQLDALQSVIRVLAYDIRGFGNSSSGTEKPSIRLYADDLIKFMDALKLNRVILCGLSMGGYIALNAISRYPERFQAIVLSDTQCIADTPESKVKRQQAIEHVEAAGLHDFAEGFIKNIFSKTTCIEKTDLVEKIKNIILSTSASTVTGTLSALAERTDMCSSLNRIAVPALILCGKEDAITPPAQSEFIRDQIRNSKLHILEHAGHLSNLEQAEEFNQQLIHFISALPELSKPDLSVGNSKSWF